MKNRPKHRVPHREVSIHHRKPVSLGGTNIWNNLSRVTPVRHKAWHTLFSNNDVHRIAEIINESWLDSDYKFVVVKKGKTDAVYR